MEPRPLIFLIVAGLALVGPATLVRAQSAAPPLPPLGDGKNLPPQVTVPGMTINDPRRLMRPIEIPPISLHPSGTPAGDKAKATSRPPEPMKVRLVRSNQPGCEPDCKEWISAQGAIVAATPGEFRKVLAKLGTRKLPILIHSPGGSVDPAYTVARLLRAKGLDVVVGKTELTTCAAEDSACLALKAKGIDVGKPDPKGSYCASACVFVLAGGVRRFAGLGGAVGLHGIKAIRTIVRYREQYRVEPGTYSTTRPDTSGTRTEPKTTLVKRETVGTETVETTDDEATYERARKFFIEMGLPKQEVQDTIMPILRVTPHSSMHWLKGYELKATGLVTDFLNGEQMLFPETAPAVQIDMGTPPLRSGVPARNYVPPSMSVWGGSSPMGVPSSAAPGASPLAAPSVLPPNVRPPANYVPRMQMPP